MARGMKIAIGLAVALALHGLLLLLAVAPGVHGLPPLDGATGETEEVFAEPPAEPEDEARTVGWAEPREDETAPKPSLDKIAIAEPSTTPRASAPDAPPAPPPATVKPDAVKPEPPKAAASKPAPVKPASPPMQTPSKGAAKAAPKVETKPVSKPVPKTDAGTKPAAGKLAPSPASAGAKPAAKSTPSTEGKPAAAAPVSADAGYANQIRQHLGRYAGALPPGASGEARVQFVVQPDGRVSDVHLVKKSGNAGLDAVALGLPVKAQPLPLPGAVPQRLEVPVQAVASTP